MRIDAFPNGIRPASWRDGLRTAAIVFVAFGGLHGLMWAFSLTPLEWIEILQAALLGGWLGLIRWAAPRIGSLLQAVAPEQLRVTLSALAITAGFFGLGIVLSVGEPGSLLENWSLLLALFLPMGFVLAMVGASEEKADGRLEAR